MTLSAPQTATEKLLARACGREAVSAGEVIHPIPERVIIHDGFVENAYRQLAGLGYARIRSPEKVVFVTDHEVAYGTQRAVERGRAIRQIADAWDVGQLFDVGRGGHGHLFPMENGLVRPGMFLFCYDMHCTNFGAMGALAMGVGTEVVSVLATGTLWMQVPQTVSVTLDGALARGVHARDVGFVLAGGFSDGRWGVDHDYRVIEFRGPGIGALDLAARVALCSSVTEIGVANVLFSGPPPDPSSSGTWVASDAGANFAGEVSLDLSALAPQVALPGGPERASPLSAVAGKSIDHAFLGSCGSGMYRDFADAARVLGSRRIAPGVRLFVVPGTTEVARRLSNDGIAQVFMDAGAVMLPPGCGPCAGGMMGPLGSGEVSISTAATNHSGRFGPADGEAFLGSPLTVAASAVTGRITDPRELIN